MFAYNGFKREIIEAIPPCEELTLYKCGSFIDLCRGPHIPHTGLVKGFKLVKVSGAYWKGDSTQPLLQRIYGVAFPKKEFLKEWLTLQEEAAKRDHRVIGKKQGLFMFHQWSPGNAFFLPPGARIYNKLMNFIRDEYRARGYQEVITPQVFNKELWETSGHWQNYREDMFSVNAASHAQGHACANAHGDNNEVMGLKPMNCPAHCLIFSGEHHSYRDLPLRLADFGVLHRNELSGALTGLTRVRRFQQDDAHIFCAEEQIESEIGGCLEFVSKVYTVLGFSFSVQLSTRPAKFLGEPALWDKAENALKQSLLRFGHPWTVNEGDGAFYGPKIDIEVTDALKRKHQCATIQLDFQLPLRFGLRYQGEDDAYHTPVMIHRAILGSVERMMAILLEHTSGRLPFWLSPRQSVILPVTDGHREYAHKVCSLLRESNVSNGRLNNFLIDVDDRTRLMLPKRVKEAQEKQYNYILVVGEREQNEGSVSVRTRDGVMQGSKTVPELLGEWKHLVDTFQ